MLIEALEQQGAKMQKSVNSKTDLLIALDNPTESKLQKARELGIRIITIEELRNSNVASTMADSSSSD
jgi:NAD-dependent DNA ligase